MFSVSWIDSDGVLRQVCSPSEETATALYFSLLDGWFVARMWHHHAKGKVSLYWCNRGGVVQTVERG